MGTLRSQLVVGMTQNVTGPAARAAAALKRLHAIGQMPIGARLDRSAKKLNRSTKQLSSSAMPIGLMGGLMLRNAYVFDKAMSRIAMTSDEANLPLEKQKENMARLRKEIVRLARENPKVRKEIAEGALEFITAGNSIDRTIASLESLTKGAVASMQTVGKTGADVTDMVAALYGNINDPKHYAAKVEESLNIMAVGASSANHTWGEQTLAMQYTAPVARALGIEFKTLTAMLGVLADNGFKGEKSGSALRTILLNLRAPTKAAREAFKDLGLEVEKAFKFNDAAAFSTDRLNNRLKSRFGPQSGAVVREISKTLNDKSLQGDVGAMRDALVKRLSTAMNIKANDLEGMSKLTKAIDDHFQAAVDNFDPDYLFKKLAKANVKQQKDITGVRRTPQALALAKGYEDQFLPKLKKINEQFEGAVGRRVTKYLDSFAGAVDQFTSKLDGFSDTIERVALVPLFHDIAKSLGSMTDALEAADPKLLKFGVYALGAAAILAPLGFAISGIGAALGFMTSAASLSVLSIAALGKGLVTAFLGTGKLGKAMSFGLFRSMRKTRREMMLMNALAASGVVSRRSMLAGSTVRGLTRGYRGLAGTLKTAGLWALRLSAASLPTLLGGAAIAGVIGYWEELGQFFKGFAAEFDKTMDANGFGRPLKAISDFASDAATFLGKAVGYIKDLFGFGEKGDPLTWMNAGKATAKALADVISGLLRPIQAAYNGLKKLFGFTGGKATNATNAPKVEARALGGPVKRGKPYIIGENGPELWSPRESGFITPNHKLRGSAGPATVNKSIGAANITVNLNINGGVANPQDLARKIGQQVASHVNDRFSDGAYV